MKSLAEIQPELVSSFVQRNSLAESVGMLVGAAILVAAFVLEAGFLWLWIVLALAAAGASGYGIHRFQDHLRAVAATTVPAQIQPRRSRSQRGCLFALVCFSAYVAAFAYCPFWERKLGVALGLHALVCLLLRVGWVIPFMIAGCYLGMTVLDPTIKGGTIESQMQETVNCIVTGTLIGFGIGAFLDIAFSQPEIAILVQTMLSRLTNVARPANRKILRVETKCDRRKLPMREKPSTRQSDPNLRDIVSTGIAGRIVLVVVGLPAVLLILLCAVGNLLRLDL